MNTGTYVPVTCAGCGKPITESTFIWNGIGMYHTHCRPPGYVVPQFGGQPLTEQRVRQIVREELERALGVEGGQEGKNG